MMGNIYITRYRKQKDWEIRVFQNNCKNTVRTMKRLIYDKASGVDRVTE